MSAAVFDRQRATVFDRRLQLPAFPIAVNPGVAIRVVLLPVVRLDLATQEDGVEEAGLGDAHEHEICPGPEHCRGFVVDFDGQ
jgi:hypothetical protein